MVLEPVLLVIPWVWVVQEFPTDVVMTLEPVGLEILRAWRALGLSIERRRKEEEARFDSLDREAAEGGGSKELQQFTVEHFGRGSMQESSYNVGAVLRSPSSPSGIG
ncbi:hypothetical protein FCV25MIE_34673 [Fagus crenata]